MRLVRTAIIPQPMSTPTAAGMMASLVGMTLPTVAPIPQCTSGMTATQPWTKGSRATLRTCWRALSSNITPRVQALIGLWPGSVTISKPRRSLIGRSPSSARRPPRSSSLPWGRRTAGRALRHHMQEPSPSRTLFSGPGS